VDKNRKKWESSDVQSQKDHPTRGGGGSEKLPHVTKSIEKKTNGAVGEGIKMTKEEPESGTKTARGGEGTKLVAGEGRGSFQSDRNMWEPRANRETEKQGGSSSHQKVQGGGWNKCKGRTKSPPTKERL